MVPSFQFNFNTTSQLLHLKPPIPYTIKHLQNFSQQFASCIFATCDTNHDMHCIIVAVKRDDKVPGTSFSYKSTRASLPAMEFIKFFSFPLPRICPEKKLKFIMNSLSTVPNICYIINCNATKNPRAPLAW